MKILISHDLDSADAKKILDNLIDYNTKYVPDDYQPLVITAKDAGELRGGLLAKYYWQWLHIDIFWLHEDCRGAGLGSKILARAEQEAVNRGAHSATLDTFDFQALPFYQKQGYEIFGQLEGYGGKHSRYYLRKKLVK